MLVQSIGKMTWILAGSFNHVNNSQYGFDTEAYVIIRFPRTFLLSIGLYYNLLLFTCRDLFYINIQGWLASDYSPGKNVSLTYLRLLICKNLLHAYHYHRHSRSISKMFSVCNSFLPVFSVYLTIVLPIPTHSLHASCLPSDASTRHATNTYYWPYCKASRCHNKHENQTQLPDPHFTPHYPAPNRSLIGKVISCVVHVILLLIAIIVLTFRHSVYLYFSWN